jgi:hypothetical protein
MTFGTQDLALIAIAIGVLLIFFFGVNVTGN